MIHHFLVNPAAGKGKVTDALIRKIHRICRLRGVEYQIHITTRQGDATEYVRAVTTIHTNAHHRFYACGGDGTLCEVINGAPRAANAEFAVIPIGTGNDFARNFTSPENFFDIDRQLDGEAKKIDLMRYNDRFSLNTINVGFDCSVVRQTGQIKRSPLVPSGVAYAAGVAITLCKPFGTDMKIELDDGNAIQGKFLLAAFANGSFYGGGFQPAPRASLTDGLIDVCVIKKISRARFVSLVGAYKAGTYVDDKSCQPFLHYKKSSRVRISFDHPIDICVDGELEMTDYVEIESVPAALSFSIPRGSLLRAEASATQGTEKATTPTEQKEPALTE